MTKSYATIIVRIALFAVAGVGVAGAAVAQSMNSNAAAYNSGYDRVADQENRGVEVGVRDANGVPVVLDGQIQTGLDQSGFASAGTNGAIDTFAGVGANSSSTSVGNSLTVNGASANNAVTSSSQQSNTGAVGAGTY
ncbi:MAG TPA: holdfast anchoring protein HfaA [Caulobacteraceae bacterium]|nr:holdfast anchoring protein HfaA [Caulobacteraceae bacterium]